METKIKFKNENREKRARLGITNVVFYNTYLSKFLLKCQGSIRVRRRMNVGSNDTCPWHLRSKIGVWHTLGVLCFWIYWL